MDIKWTTRNYKPGDEQGIIDLWRASFPEGELERAELGYWNWQFIDNPAGRGKIRLAVHDGKIVGQYTVIPMHMQVQGIPVLGTLSIDTMTHPDYRHQGMFRTLANELYAQLGENHIPLTYGFPNDNSLGGFVKKLQWKHIYTLPVYVKPLRVGAIIEQVICNPFLAHAVLPFAQLTRAVFLRNHVPLSEIGDQLHWIIRFDSRADELWHRAYDTNMVAVTRDAMYLNWRYFDNPQRDYRAVAFEENGELIAYAVVRVMKQFGLRGVMIMELESQPNRDDAIQEVIKAISEYILEVGADLATYLAHGENYLIDLLKQNGFILLPKRFSLKNWFFGVRMNDHSIDQQIINDPDNWYLTFGDTDII